MGGGVNANLGGSRPYYDDSESSWGFLGGTYLVIRIPTFEPLLSGARWVLGCLGLLVDLGGHQHNGKRS